MLIYTSGRRHSHLLPYFLVEIDVSVGAADLRCLESMIAPSMLARESSFPGHVGSLPHPNKRHHCQDANFSMLPLASLVRHFKLLGAGSSADYKCHYIQAARSKHSIPCSHICPFFTCMPLTSPSPFIHVACLFGQRRHHHLSPMLDYIKCSTITTGKKPCVKCGMCRVHSYQHAHCSTVASTEFHLSSL